MTTSLATVSVDLADPTPPFEQLRRQLAELIETGQLAAEDRLPPLRQLARDLDLAVGTVGRAYRELEQGGLVWSRRGGGTKVLPRATPSDRERAGRLDEAARAYAVAARSLGASSHEAADALTRAWS